MCYGETATLSVTGASLYTWSTSENTTDIVITPTIQTIYSVNGTDVNGCKNSTTVTQDVSLCTSVSSVALNDTQIINLYPNPNTGLFVIELYSTTHVSLINTIGQLIISENMESGKHNLDIHNQATGIYIVKCTLDDKQYTFKVIKQ